MATATSSFLGQHSPAARRVHVVGGLSSTMKRVLVVTTSANELAGNPTGVFLAELADPYYVWKRAGVEVTVASVKGGPIPIDEASRAPGAYTDGAKNFDEDPETMPVVASSPPLASLLDQVENYAALYLPGGHGAAIDMPKDPNVAKVVEQFYNAGKVVAAVCHGPAGLVNAKKASGEPLVKGLKVNSFTNAEEAEKGFQDKVPFLLETRLRELGSDFRAAPNWACHVEQDSNLITGQNPASAVALANKVLEALA